MAICTRHPLRSALFSLAVIAILLLTGCGDDGDSADASAEVGPSPASITPADAPLYGDAILKPGPDAPVAVALGRLLDTDDPGALIVDVIDSGFAGQEDDFTYDEDIEPWLGREAGGFVSDFDGKTVDFALIFAVADTEAALDAIDKAAAADSKPESDESYNGVDYKVDTDRIAVGLVGDFLLAGTEPSLKAAIDASQGEALDNSPHLDELAAAVPDGSVARLVVDPDRVGEIADQLSKADRKMLESYIDQTGFKGGPVHGWASATDDTLEVGFEGAASDQIGEYGPEVLYDLPEDAWLAATLGDFGASFSAILKGFESGFQAGYTDTPESGFPMPDLEALSQGELGLSLRKDVQPWLGNASLFVRGNGALTVGGALVIESKDPRASFKTISAIQTRIEQDGLRTQSAEGGRKGFKMSVPGLPTTFELVQDDEKVILGVGAGAVDDALDSDGRLGDSEDFARVLEAIGDDDPVFYFDFSPLTELLDVVPDQEDPELQNARRYLDNLDFVVTGLTREAERDRIRIVLGVIDAPGGGSAADPAVVTP